MSLFYRLTKLLLHLTIHLYIESRFYPLDQSKKSLLVLSNIILRKYLHLTKKYFQKLLSLNLKIIHYHYHYVVNRKNLFHIYPKTLLLYVKIALLKKQKKLLSHNDKIERRSEERRVGKECRNKRTA